MKDSEWQPWKSLPIPTIFGVGYQVWVGFILGITLGILVTWWVGILAFFGFFLVWMMVYGTYEALTHTKDEPPPDSN